MNIAPRAAHRRFDATALGWVVAAGLLTLELVKLACLEAGGPAPVAGDASVYWALGEQVAGGDVWMLERPVGFRTPGYPWCLGLARWMFGAHAWRAISVSQYLAVALTTLLTFLWTYQLSGRVWLANAALLLRVVSLAAASYASTLLTESYTQPLLVATMILLTGALQCQTWRRWTLLGVCFAVSFLFRPANLALVPVIMIAAFLECDATRPRRLLWGIGWRLGIALGLTLLLMGPWCVRNGLVFGKPVPVIFLGRELWIATFGPGRPQGAEIPNSAAGIRVRELLERHDAEQPADGKLDWGINWHVSPVLTDAGLSDAEADDLMQKVAWEAIGHDPFRAIARWIWRGIDFWRAVYDRELLLYGDELTPDTTPADQHPWGSLATRHWRGRLLDAGLENWLLAVECGSLLGIVGTLGLLLTPRTWRIGMVMSGSLLATCLLTSALDLPNYRYRMILEPLLIVGGVVGGWCWWRVVRLGIGVSWQQAGEP